MSRIVRPERETTQPTVMMTTRAENIGMIELTFFTWVGKKVLMPTPKSSGSSTIFTMEIIMEKKSMSSQAPAMSHTRKGVTKGAINVFAMVMETESATSALAM